MHDILLTATYYYFFFLDVLAQLPPAGDLENPKGKQDHCWSRIPLYRKYLIMSIIVIFNIREEILV